MVAQASLPEFMQVMELDDAESCRREDVVEATPYLAAQRPPVPARLGDALTEKRSEHVGEIEGSQSRQHVTFRGIPASPSGARV